MWTCGQYTKKLEAIHVLEWQLYVLPKCVPCKVWLNTSNGNSIALSPQSMPNRLRNAVRRYTVLSLQPDTAVASRKQKNTLAFSPRPAFSWPRAWRWPRIRCRSSRWCWPPRPSGRPRWSAYRPGCCRTCQGGCRKYWSPPRTLSPEKEKNKILFTLESKSGDKMEVEENQGCCIFPSSVRSTLLS